MTGAPRLFCLPHAGGSAALFRPWMRSAEARGLALCPLELPGRGTWRDTAPLQDMHVLVKAMADDLAPVFSSGRCALFGHSLGALVCAFLADELKRRDIAVEHVYLSAVALDPGWRNRGWSALDDTALCELLALSQVMPAEILANAEFMSRAMPTIRADLELAEQSRFDAVLDISVTVMSGARDEVAPPSLVDEWRRVCRGPFRHFEYPDGHHFLRQRLGEILALVADDLVIPPPGNEDGTPVEGGRAALADANGEAMSG
jgi:medium-chain acyl-[acyl-carrier-protein] hydrolase